MQYSLALLSLASAVVALPQGVTQDISPESSAPEGCESSYDGTFQIQVVNVSTSSTKRSISKRQNDDTNLQITLENGVLHDSEDRTGYIAANRQFQFDGPPQEGAIYTAGWSVCGNGSLAIGSNAIFYQCLSGEFYNLYDQAEAEQCSPVYINVVGSASAAPTAASQAADGQVTETPVSSAAAVSAIPDGQIQASTSAAPVSQIDDGQIQAATSATTAAPVSQIDDGQIQAATTAAPVSQIDDGQIQAATTAAPVSQIDDGQIQAATTASTIEAPVSQIPDGQIQAPSAATGGLIPVNGTMNGTATPVQPFDGAASTISVSVFALVAAVAAVFAL